MRTLTREEDVAEEQAPLLKGLIEKEVVTRGPSGELCIRVRLMEAWLRELDNERI
jgi:hypothetical protein